MILILAIHVGYPIWPISNIQLSNFDVTLTCYTLINLSLILSQHSIPRMKIWTHLCWYTRSVGIQISHGHGGGFLFSKYKCENPQGNGLVDLSCTVAFSLTLTTTLHPNIGVTLTHTFLLLFCLKYLTGTFFFHFYCHHRVVMKLVVEMNFITTCINPI